MNLENTSGIVYLVDLENIGTRTLCQHTKNHLDAEYVIFYSECTQGPGSILEQLPAALEVSFVDCKTGTDNAMDFCICAAAGMLVKKGRMVKILSDDKGYDAMLHMFHQKGIRISREPVAGYKPEQEVSGKKTGHDRNPQLIRAIKSFVPRQYQKDLIVMLSDAPNRKIAHEVVQSVVPQKMVPDIYKKLKKYIPKESM